MVWWDERSVNTQWPDFDDGDESDEALAPPPPPPPPLLSLDLAALRFDGTPAWAALVPAACASLHRLQQRPGGVACERVHGLGAGCPYRKSCTLAFELTDARGATRRVGDLARVALCALESKVTLALACLACPAAFRLCPASVSIPWDSQSLPRHLRAVITPATPWVLKRDAMSNGEGVFFVTSPEEAMDIIASQKAGSCMTFLSHAGDVSHFVLQRCLDAPRLLLGRKFHLRVYVLAAPVADSHTRSVALAVWHGLEVRLAPKLYTGDVTDRLQALTNYAPSREEAATSGLLIKRLASEFQDELGDAHALLRRVMALVEDVAAAAPFGGDEPLTALVADNTTGATWHGMALFALDVLMEGDALWLLEVNRGPAGGEESVDDCSQSDVYKAHLASLCAAILDVAVAVATETTPLWPPGFMPVQAPSAVASRSSEHRLGAQLRTLLQALPPQLQAALALQHWRASRAGAHCGDQEATVLRDLATLAGEAGASSSALAAELRQWRSPVGGRTVMHVAAQSGLCHVMPWLAALVPDLVTQADAGGATPLGLAARGGHSKAGVALLCLGADPGSDDTPLHAAAGTDSVPLIRALIACGSAVDCETETGTALHWAAGEGSVNAAGALLAAGADVDAEDADGLTPLLLAVAAGHAATVGVLLAWKADPRKARLPFGATVLHVAADAGDVDTVRALLAWPGAADLLAKRDGEGLTPEQVAVAGEASQKVVDLLRSVVRPSSTGAA
jgi:hypothetical protein